MHLDKVLITPYPNFVILNSCYVSSQEVGEVILLSTVYHL